MLRRTSLHSILCLAFVFSLNSLSAQKKLSIEEAIATALQNNYDIQLSKNDSAVAALDYSYRNSVFFPRVNANAAYLKTNSDQKQAFITGNNREGDVKTKNYTSNVSLNWTIFDGLKMFATRDKAAEFIRLGELGIKNQVINTIAVVVNNYYDIVRQKQQLRVVEEQMSINQTRVDLSQRKLDIGVGAKPDVLQSKVDLNAQKAAQLRQLTLIQQLKETLNQVMNVPAGLSYEVSDSIPLNTTLSLGEIQSKAITENPLLQIQKKNIDIANLTLKERKADRFPILALNSAYNLNRTDNDITVNPAFPLYSRNRGYNYGISATVPIFNNNNVNRQIKQAQLNIDYQKLLYENQKSVINVGVMNAFKDYELQKQSLDLEESNILLARENVSIILETYKLGSATYLQLREAQKSLEDAYNRLIAARYNTKLAETELLRLKGELVK